MKNIKFQIGFTLMLLSVMGWSGCGCEHQTNEAPELALEPMFPSSDTTFATVDIAAMLQMEDGQMKMYTLPTPLQVTSLLDQYKIAYAEKEIIPIDYQPTVSTSFYNSLTLGMYVIDMGYSVTYDDSKRAFRYLEEVTRLMNTLGLNNAETNYMLGKFRQNMGEKDSLYKYILTSYGDAHHFFQDEGREGVGLLILTGAYLEGLNLSLHTDFTQNPALRDQVLIQQKFFLNNIRELLGFYSGYNHIGVLLYKLQKITAVFDKLDVEYKGTLQTPYALKAEIAPEIIHELKKNLGKLRSEILQ